MWTNGTRRHFLQTTGLGIGWLAALDLFGAQEKKPPLPATAKSVIHLFMQGGPSHVDTFDPKPLLSKLDGQHPPASFGNDDFMDGQLQTSVLLGSRRTFQRRGQSGLEV